MTTTTDIRRARIELAVGALPASEFAVVSFSGREALNKLFRFEVDAVSRGRDVPVSSLLGQPARLMVHGPSGTRFVHGVALRIERTAAHTRGDATFTLGIAPRLSLLGRRKTSRIFQDATVPEIVLRVASEIGVRVALHTARSYEKRAYCVQYQETDLAFLRRLLAEEGLFDYFQHPPTDPDSVPAEEGRETWVVADAPSHYMSAEGGNRFTLRDRLMAAEAEGVHAFALRDSVREGGALVRGFDYERPKFVPVAEASTSQAQSGLDLRALRVYDHDRVLDDKTVGRHVPELRLDALRRAACVAHGESDVRGLMPGMLLRVDGHPWDQQHAQLVVTAIRHRGSQADANRSGPAAEQRAYENRFECVPASVAFRPKRKPRRLMQVTETAVVVGPQENEIHTDELGRIKIQFHWDLEGKHNEHSSCWMRVMQAWAGQAWGSQFIPRVGMEVVVTFAGGDTDRPLVLGCVYNGATPPPFPLPEEQTKSGLRTRSSPGGAGYNELSFDDKAGEERVFLHAERDFDQVIEHDHTRVVRGHEAIRVTENRIVEVEQDNVRVVRGNEVLLIEKNLILHVAGHKLFQIGSPPEQPEEDARSRALPEDASVYAAFEALASLPLFEDANVARNSQIRRSKILWHAEQLQGDDYRAAQVLLGRVSDLDKKLDGLCGAAHLLTEDVRTIPERIREAEPSADPVGSAAKRAEEILERAADLKARMTATLDECGSPVPPLAKLQQSIVDHVAHKRERVELVIERVATCSQALADVPAFIAGMRHGGGGGGNPSAGGAFAAYADKDGKTKGTLPDEVRGSVMKITGPGEIVASDSFKITCGKSSIELTPGSISIKSDGPIKINGSEVLINC